MMTYGYPGSVTPATSRSPDLRCASYQRFGIWWPRCISFDKSGLPVVVCAPETTQLFEPGRNDSSCRSRLIQDDSIRADGDSENIDATEPDTELCVGGAASRLGVGVGWVGGWSRQEAFT